jgi:hypothetical protein
MQFYAILAYRNYRYWSKCKTQDVLTCWLMSNKSEIRTELLAWRCDAFCNCLHCCRLVPLASQVLVPLEQAAGHVRTIRSIRTSKISKSYLNCFELIFELRIYLIWIAIAWYAKWRVCLIEACLRPGHNELSFLLGSVQELSFSLNFYLAIWCIWIMKGILICTWICYKAL